MGIKKGKVKICPVNQKVHLEVNIEAASECRQEVVTENYSTDNLPVECTIRGNRFPFLIVLTRG